MLDWLTLLAAAAAVAVGSVLQAASGVGAGFIVMPMLAWLHLSLVPGPAVFGSLALSGIMTWQERGAIDRRSLPALMFGLLPGSLLGGWVLSAVPADRLGLLFGLVILFALTVSLAGLDIALNRRNAAAAGVVAGAMGASTGVGAPILAILYQHEPVATVRSTLALIYLVGSVMIVIALMFFGEFAAADAMNGAALIPGFLIGFYLANRYRHRLENAGTRPLVLGASAIAAVTLIVRSLLG